MRKIALLFSVILMGSLTLLAQNQRVSGLVTGPDGNPVSGVTVIVSGTTMATVTGADGRYSLNAPANGTLDFSLLGMEPQSVAVSGRSTVDVQLASDTTMIGEVVVTGYSTMSRTAFTGVATTVGAETIAKRTDASFLKALEGNVPGIIMNNSTSAPGAWGKVTIRGRGSLTSGTEPLYVVDGIPVNSDSDSMRGNDDGNAFDPMASINPNDIESVTILKDAAATGIYGSRASNGVIVITTKKGTPGQFNLNLDIKQGFQTIANNNMKYANASQTLDHFARGYMAAASPQYENVEAAKTALTNKYKTTWGWDGVSSYDWFDAVTRQSYFQDYNLSVSGRNESTGYYASLGYYDTDGIVIGSHLKRYSGRLNVNSKFKIFTFGANTSFSFSEKEGFGQGIGGSFSNPLVGAASGSLPFYPFYNEDGEYANTPVTGMPSGNNPLALYDKKLGNINSTSIQNFLGSVFAQVDFGGGFYAKSTFGASINDSRQYEYWSALYSADGYRYNGLGQAYNWHTTNITWTNIIGWNRTFNNLHTVSAMLAQEAQHENFWYDYYGKPDFPFAASGMRDLATAGGDDLGMVYNKEELRGASYFFDGHYSYDNKYVVGVLFRRDGASVFGIDKLWGNFGAVSAKWRLTGENWFRDNGVLTDANIRASYGVLGNQDLTNRYAARGFYTSGSNYDETPGMVPNTVPNPSLTWESSNKLDVGFDVSFLDRFNLSFNFYNDITSSALYSVPVSMTTGLASTMRNIGKIRNRGIEISIDGDIISNRDLTWRFNANLTHNQNRIVKLATKDPIEGEYFKREVGRPYNQFFIQEYAGVDSATGKPLWYANKNGEGDQSATTSTFSAAPKRYLGSADPKLMGGFGTSLDWKGLDFNLSFIFRLGAQVYDRGASFIGWGMTERVPLLDVYENSWTPEKPDAKYPQWRYGDPDGATQRSSRFIYNANFLRLSNVSLGYTLPERWTKSIKIQKARIYVSADNVYTFTAKGFTGYTPESYDNGVIAWQYPLPTTITGGVQISF